MSFNGAFLNGSWINNIKAKKEKLVSSEYY